MIHPEGIYVPNITPFNVKGEILYNSLKKLIEFWLKSEISGLVVNASTGEAPYLSREEKSNLIRFVVEEIGDEIQVFAGTGAMGTKESIELTKDALDAGAEAALVATPFFFKPRDHEIKQHYIDIMQKVDLPVILYNVPKFTGYNVNPKIIAEISDECSALVAVKDSSGNPGNMSEIIRLCGKKVSALSGSADMILPTLMLGGKGAIVAVGNVIPKICVHILKSYKNGDLVNAGENQKTASFVNKILVRDNPQIAAIKTALIAAGYNAGIPRKPLQELSPSEVDKIIHSLNDELLPKGM
jgi:4-hydroxy-tetrahydrodipicolinate synthase